MHPNRLDNLQRILQLDPETQHQEIVQIVGMYEYPWLMIKALEFALFRTYAVPSISGLLDRSGQFYQHGQRRYDDTSLLIAEITENGYESARGKAAIRRMNALHGRWQISNDDYLYVLSCFIFVPIYFHARFGWRQPTQHENRANYYFWRAVGERMNMHDIPQSIEAFERFHKAYEREHFVYSASNQRVAEGTIAIFLSWYPQWTHPLIREVIYALLDDPLRVAFGFPKPHSTLEALVVGGLKAAAIGLRYAPPRKTPFHLTQQPNRTYPQGYDIEQMGPKDQSF